jgi:hypothetical protein
MNTLLDVIDGAEKSGADSWNAPHCPNCGTGEDRLVIWPNSGDSGRVYCRNCDWGRSNHPEGPIDGIEYLRQAEGMSFHEACEFFGVERKASKNGTVSRNGTPDNDGEPYPEGSSETDYGSNNNGKPRWKEYSPPDQTWRTPAHRFCGKCKEHLWSQRGAAQSALEYLRSRGFLDRTIRNAGLGVNPEDRFPKRTEWGLPPNEKREGAGKLWLPRGIVVPWADSEGISNVNIRRPDGDVLPSASESWKQRKYQQAAGPWSPLWGVKWIRREKPIVLVEGEFDALAVRQEAADLCTPVATGSTGGARREQWREKLLAVPTVLVSFDSEKAGEEASLAWNAALPNAYRWHPHAEDPSEMLEYGNDVRLWVRCGVDAARRTT